MSETKDTNEAACGGSALTAELATDIEYLRNALTEKQIAAVREAATTLSGTVQHSRAMHIMGQALPPLALHGILLRVYRVANSKLGRQCKVVDKKCIEPDHDNQS